MTSLSVLSAGILIWGLPVQTLNPPSTAIQLAQSSATESDPSATLDIAPGSGIIVLDSSAYLKRGKPRVTGSFVLTDSVGRAAIRPWVIPDVPSEKSSGAAWLRDPLRRNEAISVLWAALASVPFGRPWSEWRKTALVGRQCSEFRGDSYGYDPDPEDYWIYRCWTPVSAGTLEFNSYLLDEDLGNEQGLVETSESRRDATLERTLWTMTTSPELPDSILRLLYRSLAETLTVRTGARGMAPRSKELAENASISWKEGREFRTESRLFWLFLAESRSGLQLALDSFSPALESQMIRVDRESVFEWETRLPLGGRGDIVQALQLRWPKLARALTPKQSRLGDVELIQAALSRARSGAADASERDLLAYAAHVWLKKLPTSVTNDFAAKDQILRSLAEFGLRLHESHYDTGWAYCGSLLQEIVARSGSNPWAAEALVEFLELGGDTTCECGETEAFATVIREGEKFLRERSESRVWSQVALAVAWGHETAWSLSRAPEDDEYIDRSLYLFDAQRHRARAEEMYRALLSRTPQGWDERIIRRLRRSLHRIEMDVDTGFRPYYCLCD